MGFNEALDQASKVGGTVGQVIGGINAVKGLFTNQRKAEERADQRQINQQGKLNDVNAKTSKELADYEQNLKLQMWKDTNYGEQMKQAGMAGLSKVAVLGGSGTGTQGASVGTSGIGGGASGGAQNQMAGIESDLAKAQTANLMANTGKTIAETKKIGGVDTGKTTEETRGIKFNNDLNATMQDTIIEKLRAEANIIGINEEKLNASWETLKATGYATGDFKDVNSRVAKQMIAEMEMAGQQLENAKKDGNIKEAEKTIKEFEAELTKEGIAPNSPFYVKIMGDLLGKIGLNPIKGIGGGSK